MEKHYPPGVTVGHSEAPPPYPTAPSGPSAPYPTQAGVPTAAPVVGKSERKIFKKKLKKED